MKHQHEEWQIRESASGGFYCAACGEHLPTVETAEVDMDEFHGGTVSNSVEHS